MDLKVKGISWVGNVYQKFEAMCLEVEDAVCQSILPFASMWALCRETNKTTRDTLIKCATSMAQVIPLSMVEVLGGVDRYIIRGPYVEMGFLSQQCMETAKYVESQVQTVGSSVKKFYAEVMQDLLPPSSLDPKEIEGTEQNAAFGTCHKQKLSTEGLEKDNSPYDDGSEIHVPAVKGLCEKQKDEADVCKRSNAGTKKYPINERLLPVDMSEVIISGKSSSQASLCSRVHSTSQLLPSLSVDPVVAAGSRLFLEQNCNDEVCRNSTVPIDKGPLKANLSLTAVSEIVDPAGEGTCQASSFGCVRKEDNAKPCDKLAKMTSSIDFTICNSPEKTRPLCSNRMVESGHAADSSSAFQSSCSVLPVASRERKIVESGLTTFSGIPTEANGLDPLATFDTCSRMGSSWNGHEHFCEEVTDDTHSESDKGDDIVEQELKTTEEFQKAKLEESCIVVDVKELPFVPHHTGRQRSYKKKFRDALASRMRLAKKQENEQLATWQGDTSNPRTECSSPSVLTGDLKKSSTHDTSESEWELL